MIAYDVVMDIYHCMCTAVQHACAVGLFFFLDRLQYLTATCHGVIIIKTLLYLHVFLGYQKYMYMTYL